MTTENEAPNRAPVKFERPPIFEVACGVLFSGQRQLVTADIGAYWQRIRSEFPRAEDAAPIPNFGELSDGSGVATFEFSNLPPLRRAWFFSAGGQNLIQLQQDRFVFNWKRSSDSDPYPSYDVVIELFEKHLAGFRDFCCDVGVGDLSFRQCELTYVNQITQANGLARTGLSDLLVDHERSHVANRYLPVPDAINWATVYELPNSAGRLQIVAQSAVSLPKKEKLVRLDLAARGATPDMSDSGRRAWFNMAHEWITQGFADVTNPILHTKDHWQRTS